MNDESHLRCYRKRCNNPADPRCWNRITNGMYCLECACLIDDVRTGPGGPLFPYKNSPKADTGQWAWPAVRIRIGQTEKQP